MIRITRVVLDILKPHDPDVVEFAAHLAAIAPGLHVSLDVIEVDDKTQTIEVVVNGQAIELPPLLEAVSAMGASLHSVDGVDIVNDDAG